jgi:hypothetical protein
MIAVLFSSLKSEEYEWLEKHYNKYNCEELSQLKAEYVDRMKSALLQVYSEVNQDKVDQDTK